MNVAESHLAARTQDEAQLAGLLMAGDPAAPRLIWQKFLPLVRRMARRALGAGADIDDVVQEVFCCLFRGIRQLREPEAFRAFVITVTKRTLGHELRRRRARRHLNAATDVQLADAVGEWTDPATHHAYRHFGVLLARLKERERRAFVLRYVECMDAPEVAQALGVSVPTARRAFSRAQARLLLWAGRHPFLSDYLVEGAMPSDEELSTIAGASSAA